MYGDRTAMCRKIMLDSSSAYCQFSVPVTGIHLRTHRAYLWATSDRPSHMNWSELYAVLFDLQGRRCMAQVQLAEGDMALLTAFGTLVGGPNGEVLSPQHGDTITLVAGELARRLAQTSTAILETTSAAATVEGHEERPP